VKILSGDGARVTLALLFVTGLIIGFVLFYAVYAERGIRGSELQDGSLSLLGVYSVHLSIIIGGVFGSRAGAKSRVPMPAFLLAVLTASIWNLLIVGRMFAFATAKSQSEDVAEVIKYIETIAASSSFLVAGVLTYFFSKTSKNLHSDSA
jgi:hypothetical protein